jgi:hypothetical protein
MKPIKSATHQCQICHKNFDPKLLYPLELVRPSISRFIKEKFPDLKDQGEVCVDDLHKYRALYIESILKKEIGETRGVEKKFIKSLKDHELIAEDTVKPLKIKSILRINYLIILPVLVEAGGLLLSFLSF